MKLQEILDNITGQKETAMEKARMHWDRLAKPLGSLGTLEADVVRIAGVTGKEEVQIAKPVLLVLCADNGVVAQGVTQSDSSVTAAVATALGKGCSTVNFMAREAGCQVIPVDVGILDFAGAENVLNRRVMNGTNDITTGPAMSREACIRAIEIGVDLVRQQRELGADIILTGEMGIGNTTTSCAVGSVMLQVAPGKIVGRGAGLTSEGLVRKQKAIEDAIALQKPDQSDPIDVLQKVGGLDLAALCGVYLGGALYGVPVLLDGVISNIAALCAVRLCPNAKKALIASHVSAEPLAKLVLEALDLDPIISAGMRLGEGSGAVAALSLIKQALGVYNSGNTFGNLGIDAYVPLT